MGRLAAALIVLGLVTASCSAEERARPTPPAPTTPSPPPTAREVLLDRIDRATDRKGVDLTTATLPEDPPDGFSRSDVSAVGLRVLMVVTRGMDPRLSEMSARKALRYVFAGQLPDARGIARSPASDLDKDHWKAYFLTRFDEPASGPRYLASRWEVGSSTRTAEDGSSFPVLEVELQVLARFDVPVDGQATPIVVVRTFGLSSFQGQIRSGSTAGMSYSFNALFSDSCAFSNGGIIRPSTRQQTLGRDLRSFRAFRKALTRGSLFDAPGREVTAVAPLPRCESPS